MCGIAGLWDPAGLDAHARSEVAEMIATLHHRGPDGSGVHVEPQVALGHARLSIIDLAGGAQPLANEHDDVWVTFNGEIFNYVELREALLAQGHTFRTRSDTEVLVHLYEQHGDAFVEHLNGQFAIALWDARRQRLVLARDRVGIRPLFHARSGRRLAFASEVKALFALPDVPRRLDPAGLAGVFSLWAAVPPATPFESVSAVPPGHIVIADAQGVRAQRYWQWPFASADELRREDEDTLADELHALLIDAVRLQLRSDVPVAAYLSGGLDSSIVTSIIARHTDTPLRSFSIGFEGAEFDEGPWQRTLIDHLRSDHRGVHCSRAAIGAAFARMVRHAEAPVVRTAPTPMMLLADTVRADGFKVVLTGEGADEIFGGYDIFKEARVRRMLAAHPDSAWRARILERLYPYLAHSPTASRALSRSWFAEGLRGSDDASFAHAARIATTQRTTRFFRAEWRERIDAWDPHATLTAMMPPQSARWEPLARDQFVEANTLLPGYLLAAQGDRVAMAASIEARFPFLDHRVIEFAARLPARVKLRGLREKRLLKRAMRAELPPAIHGRTKQPFRAPDSESFFVGGQPLPYVAELLSRERLDAAGLFDAAAVGKLVAKCAAGRAVGFGDNQAFVGILSTMLVHEQLVLGHSVA